MPIVDKVQLWQSKEFQAKSNMGHRVPWDDRVDIDDDFEEFPELQEYRQAILNSPAYSWLLQSVLKEIELEIPGSLDRQTQIRQHILEYLGEPTLVSRKNRPATGRLRLILPWLSEFFASQEYDIPAHEALRHVIVLTGDDSHAFAGSCLQYIQAVWPEFGTNILDFYESLLRTEIGTRSECKAFFPLCPF